MSRPRKPFGANHPGRVPATMMKVLAAEMSDPSRLRRGKQYANDGSVLDIIIEPGVVTCEIQGSRSTPYIASVNVTSGDGMPLRRDISTTCTCPDDDNWDGYACKHVVASMFVLSDEFLLEPELLDLWRGREVGDDDRHDRSARGDVGDDDGDGDVDDDDAIEREHDDPATGGTRPRRHLHLVRSEPDEGRRRAPDTPRVDRLAELTGIPDGATLPEIPDIDRVEPDVPRDRQLAAVLRDAINHLRIEWE